MRALAARSRRYTKAAGCCSSTDTTKARRWRPCSRRSAIGKRPVIGITQATSASPSAKIDAMTTQILPRPLVNQLLRHAQHQPEQEVCGLIGNRGDAMHFYPVANKTTTPQCLYEMDPAQQIGTLRLMRERGEALFAIYHARPRAPPAPAGGGRGQAAGPGARY